MLPLPTLLSQVLVAFTIEFDNEVDHSLVHQTTNGGRDGARRGAPWLVSQVMWANVMQYVGEDGIRVRDLHAKARTTRDSLAGLQRWGYIKVGPDPSDKRPNPPKDELVVRPTAAGRRAQEVWRPLAGMIEDRWRVRHGRDAIDELEQSLRAVVDQLDVDLPRYLPIVYPTKNGKADVPLPKSSKSSADQPVAPAPPDLSVLLSQVLLGFTIDFERDSAISLPISANTLRVLSQTGVRVRDLPPLTGVSKEANSMSTGFLERHGLAVTEADPSASRGKVVRLTAKGQIAQHKYVRILNATEEHWTVRFGQADISRLRDSLNRVVNGDLGKGLEPYPDGWRASIPKPATLPHYPMVLHRGGYPDGS